VFVFNFYSVYSYLPVGVDGIFVDIFDERAFTTDERIAWAHVKIPDIVFTSETSDDWLVCARTPERFF
jgi:toll-interacting protein